MGEAARRWLAGNVMGVQKRKSLTAVAWACAGAVCVLVWAVPPFTHVVIMMLGPLCTVSGVLAGWGARGRHESRRAADAASNAQATEDRDG